MNRKVSGGGIYAIKNKINGKVYVGQAVNIKRRFYDHFRELRAGNHKCKHFQSAFKKYGEDVFFSSVIEKCSNELLTEREQYWMDFYGYKNTYNTAPAAGSTIGIKQTPETCAKISASKMGNHNRTGIKHTKAARAKISAAGKGRKYTAETIAKRAAANTGQKRSPEARARMSAAQAGKGLGRKHTIETRVKMSEAGKRKVFTEEHKRNISISKMGNTGGRGTKGHIAWNKGKLGVFSKEALEKMSLARTLYWERRRSID